MCSLCVVDRVKRLREDETLGSSQSHRNAAEDLSQKKSSFVTKSRSVRERRNYRNHTRSSPSEKSSPVRPIKPYAAGMAAQLSQRRKQLEDRAKEKLKFEKENRRSPAVDSEGIMVDLPVVREKKKIVIEIPDDDEQSVPDSETVSTVDLCNSLPQASIKADDSSVKDDGNGTSTANSGTPLSTNDASTEHNDGSKNDAGQMCTNQGSTDCSAARSASATGTISLMNLPMPPVDSDSDSEATPLSAEEQQL